MRASRSKHRQRPLYCSRPEETRARDSIKMSFLLVGYRFPCHYKRYRRTQTIVRVHDCARINSGTEKKTHTRKRRKLRVERGKSRRKKLKTVCAVSILLRMAFSASFYAGDELSCRIVPPQFAEDVTDPSPDRSFRRQTPPELRVVRRKKGADGSRKQ